jgi:hypothetical protein
MKTCAWDIDADNNPEDWLKIFDSEYIQIMKQHWLISNEEIKEQKEMYRNLLDEYYEEEGIKN